MSENQTVSTTPSWREILRLAGTKALTDYNTRVRPKVRRSQRKLGRLLVKVGEKLESKH